MMSNESKMYSLGVKGRPGVLPLAGDDAKRRGLGEFIILKVEILSHVCIFYTNSRYDTYKVMLYVSEIECLHTAGNKNITSTAS